MVSGVRWATTVWKKGQQRACLVYLDGISLHLALGVESPLSPQPAAVNGAVGADGGSGGRGLFLVAAAMVVLMAEFTREARGGGMEDL